MASPDPSLWILLPIKAPERAKARLGGAVGAEARRTVALALARRGVKP